MPARKTERGLPAGFDAAALGEAVTGPSAALISFHSSPIVIGRKQTYVAFALDPSLQTNVSSYRWKIGSDATESESGVFEHVPDVEGNLGIEVGFVDGGGTELATLALDQIVVPLNTELEDVIGSTSDGEPEAADPDTSREIVNDVRNYIDEVAPRSADSESSLNRLLFALTYAEAMRVRPDERSAQIEQMAEALEQSAATSFADLSEFGIGLCQLRPSAVAMYLSATPGGSDWLISPSELPTSDEDRPAATKDLKAQLAALDEQQLIDLFNLLRFPKSSIGLANVFAQGLMNQYFSGESLPSILADEDKAHTLINQFKEGPFALA